MMGYYGDGMGWGGWLAMSLSFVVFWGLLIALVVWLVRSFRADASRDNQGLPPAPERRADEVLAERFARGEIDAEEFTQRRELLHSTRGRVGPGGGASR
jgi:putative membrane protein